MLKLHIENFQSIKKCTLCFDIGINLIVGQSNSGKTACIRALDALLTNTSDAKSMVQHGSRQATVTMELDDYPKVTWTRTATASTYDIGEEHYEKTGRTNLFELMHDCGFVLDDKKNVVNIQGEWDTLFPFSRNESELFKLFENIFCLPDSSVILHKIKQDDDTCSKQIKDHEQQIKTNKLKLDSVKTYLDVIDSDILIEGKDFLTSQGKKLDEMNRLYDNLKVDLSRLTKIKDIKQVPNLELDSFFEMDSTLEYLESKSKLLDSDIKTLDVDLTDLSSYFIIDNTYKEIASKIKLLKFDIKPLQLDTSFYESFNRLDSTFKEIEIVSNSIDNLDKELVELNKTKEELEKELSKIASCPLCGSSIKEEHHA